MNGGVCAFELATILAIERRSFELLVAVLELGMIPNRPYVVAPQGVGAAITPLEHARFRGWTEGVSRMSGVH